MVLRRAAAGARSGQGEGLRRRSNNGNLIPCTRQRYCHHPCVDDLMRAGEDVHAVTTHAQPLAQPLSTVTAVTAVTPYPWIWEVKQLIVRQVKVRRRQNLRRHRLDAETQAFF